MDSFNKKAIQKVLNETRKGDDCQKWKLMYFLHERCTDSNHVFRRDGFHNVEIHEKVCSQC